MTVALDYQASATEATPRQNRVGSFFAWSQDCAGETDTQTVDCDWEIDSTSTILRQGNSLTQKENELPPCSEFLKDGVTVTAQSFIQDKFIENKVPWRYGYLKGDGRGFLDSPADGIENTYRGSNSITIAPDGNISQRAAYGLSVWYDDFGAPLDEARADESKHFSTGNLRRNGDFSFWLTSSAGEPFDSWITDVVAPIRVEALGTMDVSTGRVHMSGFTTEFPSFQVFVNGVSVYNRAQDPWPEDIIFGEKFKVNLQLCDPGKWTFKC